jgi:hypothetical protein
MIPRIFSAGWTTNGHWIMADTTFNLTIKIPHCLNLSLYNWRTKYDAEHNEIVISGNLNKNAAMGIDAVQNQKGTKEELVLGSGARRDSPLQ